MERMRTRRPSMRPQPAEAPKPTYELLKPDTEWSQDDSNRILLVRLPGFKRDEIKVQLDNSGKLIIRGSRKVTENKFVSVDQSVDVPKDVTAEKVAGRFDNGCLTLTMPIIKQKRDERKEELTQLKPTEDGEEKKDETTEQETPKTADEQERDEPKPEPMQPKTINGEEKKVEPTKEEMLKTDEQKRDDDAKLESGEKKEEPIMQETKMATDDVYKGDEGAEPSSSKKKDESLQQEKEEKQSSEFVNEEKKEDSVRNGTANATGEDSARDGTTAKENATGEDSARNGTADATVHPSPGSRKRRAIWRDSNLLEKMKRNRKVIAVAAVAFSVGFYVSHTLKSECSMM